MRMSFPTRARPLAAGALVLALAPALAGCMGGVPTNRTMYSEHQPVVQQVNYTLDLNADGGGLAYGEAQRLSGWLDAMDLKYGDKLYVDDPATSAAARQAIAALAERRGILMAEGAPITEGYIQPGTLRVIIARMQASVPSCPSWTSNSDFNPGNGLSSNYGCATNSNLAAMVADPEDLLHGAEGDGETNAMTSTKAIQAYREAAPTGNGNTVSEASTTTGGQ